MPIDFDSDTHKLRGFLCALAIVLFGFLAHSPLVTAAVPQPQNPQNGSIGVEGTIPSPPPTQAATIVSPANGQTFTTVPITVSGFCKTGLLVKVFSNNIFVGSVMCVGGSYSVKVDLFNGRNDLIARVYDALDQQGPDSNKVTVTFRDAQFTQFGSHVSLTSDYARRGVNPGDTLTWPVILSDGVGPYAISVDWGDSSATQLISELYPGVINLTHIYNSAGTYNITVKATDKNGTTAFLQLVAVANGKVTQSNSGSSAGGSTSGNNNSSKGGISSDRVIAETLFISVPVSIFSFWLGRRYELSSIRRQLEKNSRL